MLIFFMKLRYTLYIAVKRYSFEHLHERGKENSSGNL